MKYTSGTIGRTIIAKIEDGDDLLACLIKIAKNEKINSGIVFVIGAIHKNRAVCGPRKSVIPPEPLWQSFSGPSEIVAVGTIFRLNNQPKIHLHSGIGRGNKAIIGCLRDKTKVFLIAEAIIMEIKNKKAVRRFDKKSKLSLLYIA